MFGYYLNLALRSLKRNKMLTALMVVTIGFGVGASMTTYAVFRAVSGNPIPHKSAELFKPQIDNWGPTYNNDGKPPAAMTYTDAMALMRAHAASRQTVSYPVRLSLVPGERSSKPLDVFGYATYASFFGMFDVPFKYGGGWPAADDERHASAVVISAGLNQRLFGGANSVGRSLNLDGHDYRIVGVTRPWNPRPRFYDVANGRAFATDPPQLWIPFTRAIDLKIDTAGNYQCSGAPAPNDAGWDGRLRSECVWFSYWAELPNAAAVKAYRRYLHGYAARQRSVGRFTWAPNGRLWNVMQWLHVQKVVPSETRISLLLSLAFLLVCLVNTVGLLLAKFMRRAPEIGVRRALGASRLTVYAQFLTEAGMVGVAGGVLGLLLTVAGVFAIGLVFPSQIARLAHIDLALVGLTLLASIVATIAAGFYPTWRASTVQPAWQLKSN